MLAHPKQARSIGMLQVLHLGIFPLLCVPGVPILHWPLPCRLGSRYVPGSAVVPGRGLCSMLSGWSMLSSRLTAMLVILQASKEARSCSGKYFKNKNRNPNIPTMLYAKMLLLQI